MTTNYLDSKRISALSSDFIGTSGWTTSNSSSIGISGNEITIQERNGDYDEVAYKSFTALGADASFTFRFPIKITTITQTGGTDSIRVVMGVSSASDIADSTARDEVGIIWRVTDTINKFYAFTADGTALTSHYSGTDFATTPSTTGGDGNGNYYVEISGSGGTYTFKLFSDSTYDTLIESESITDAGITGLQYYVFRTWELTTHSNQARATVTISDKPNSVQDNSILVEKDTGNRYWFDAEISNLALTDPTPASSDYTNSGSSFTFASNKIHVDAVGYGSTLTMCTRPLTTTFIPTTNGCMIDFKFNWTTAGGSGNDTGVAIGLFDTRAQADGTNNGINIEFVTSPSYARNVQFRCEGIFDNSSTQGYPVPDEYYCRIIVQKDGSATGKGYTSEADRTADTNAVFSRSTAAQTGFSEKTIFGILNKRPTGGGNVVGDLDSINVYSGITATTPATWTMNPTYETDFSTSTGWTADTADITYDATNYEIDWSADGTASSQVKSYDLTSVSDTKWVLRTKVNIKNFSANTNADWNQFSIGLGSASTNMNTAKDYGGFIVSNLTGGDAGYQALMTTSDQNRFGTIFSRSMSAETLYVEMIRESDTVFRVNLYSDSDYSSLLETQTDTVSAGTVTDLRYLLISTNRQSSEGGTNNGSVDDIKFYNGVTSV